MSYEEIRSSNILEKEMFLKKLFEEDLAKEGEGSKAAPAAPKRKKKRKVSPSPAPVPRKSSRMKPGPAPSYKEDDEEASGRRSRRDGSARREARAYSHPQLLRPRRRVNYVEEEVLSPVPDGYQNAIFSPPSAQVRQRCA